MFGSWGSKKQGKCKCLEDARLIILRERSGWLCNYCTKVSSWSGSIWFRITFVSRNLKHEWIRTIRCPSTPHKLAKVFTRFLIITNLAEGGWPFVRWSWKCIQWGKCSKTTRYISSYSSWCSLIHPQRFW